MDESTSKGLKQQENWFSQFLYIMNFIGCVLIMVVMCIIVVDVFGRVVFNHPLVGAVELIQVSIVCITFLQIPFVQMIEKHLQVTVVYDHLSKRVKGIVDVISNTMGSVVFALMAYSGWDLLLKALKSNEFEGDGAIRIPSWPIRATIVLCSIVTVFVFVVQIIQIVQKNKIKKEA